ncbi:MAG: formate/nitrite transporter family protein [Candidatus Cryptobacteroides sp.]
MIEKSLLKEGFLAGAMIGIAGFAYLAVGGFYGALLFSFGLVSIYLYKLKLFTGTAGNVSLNPEGFLFLLCVLLLNFAGAGVISLFARVSPLEIQEKAVAVVNQRLMTGWWKCGMLAILCGLIVDEAVHAWKSQQNILPTILGVCVFVLCGFCHCIADAFYISLVPVDMLKADFGRIAGVYLSVVAGNFIGCNVRRFFRL